MKGPQYTRLILFPILALLRSWGSLANNLNPVIVKPTSGDSALMCTLGEGNSCILLFSPQLTVLFEQTLVINLLQRHYDETLVQITAISNISASGEFM